MSNNEMVVEMKDKVNLGKLVRILFPGVPIGFFIGCVFGINSILYGYGDGKLLIYYLIVFCLAFFVLSLILHLYSKLRKIPPTIYNNSFLLCTALVSFFALYILSFITKFIFQHILKDILDINTRSFLFIVFVSFILSFLLFIWLSRLYKKARGYFLSALIVCLIAPWVFISLKEGSYFKKNIYADQYVPNILLLTVESLRYDYLRYNGNSQIKTPAFDSLAKKGVVFDNYFVQAPYTTVSLSSLLTGYYPFHHGARQFGQKPNSKYQPFIEKLADNGYSIKIDNSFSSILFPNLSRYNTNINEEKASVLKALYYGLIEFPFIINDQLGELMPFFFGEYCFGNTTSSRQTLKLLQQIRYNRKKKWFFWVHFIHNCHWPYGAPSYFTKMYTNNDKSIKTYFSKKEIDYLNENPKAITDDIVQGIKATYSAEVSCIDKQIGIIVDYLKKLSLLEKTVIIVSADHGELLGETGFIGHGDFLNDALIHVPLIIYLADSGYLAGGKRITNLTEEVDIAPTILDICGIDTPQKFDGRSLLNIINSNNWHKNSIYSEVFRDEEKTFLLCYRTKEYKFLWNSSNNELMLYNIISDPNEKENLANRFPEMSAKMKRQLLDFTDYPNLDALKPDIKAEIDKDVKERLKALGYIKE